MPGDRKLSATETAGRTFRGKVSLRRLSVTIDNNAVSRNINADII